MAKGHYDVIVHPKIEMTRSGFITFFVTVVPVFAVLYWYTAPMGVWGEVLAAQILLAVACLLTLVRQRRVFTGISSDSLVGNGIFSRTETIPLENIQEVVIVPVYRSDPDDVGKQLVVLDADGRCVFRMRGYYWHPGDLMTVATSIGRPVTQPQTPITEVEFFEEYPGSRYWFERNAGLRAGLIIGTALLGATVVLLAWSAGVRPVG